MVGIIVVTAIALMLGYMLFVMFKAQKLKGETLPRSIPEIDALVDNNKKALLYFYSPNCGQCTGISPIIDDMAKQGKAVLKIDISQQVEAAKALNVRATPTLLLVINGQIKQIILGAKSKTFIENLLN